MVEKNAAAISPESTDYLEEVKKGKPRKFAMICKGTSVVSLVVYKKGNVEKRKKEAKEAGKGQFYFGAVDGKGMDIRFVLARADGFESEPVKATVLKTFLDDSAGMKCKPYFEIVDELPLVLDEDDPLVARYLRLKEAAASACMAHPERAEELNGLCRQIGGHLDREQTDEATTKLDQLETVLASLGSVPGPSADVPPAAGPAPSNEMEQFVARLKGLMPSIAKAKSGTSPLSEQIAAAAGEAAAFAREKDFAQANGALDRVEELLSSISTSESSSTSEPDTQSRYEHLYLGLLETIPGDVRRVENINHSTAATLQKVVDGAASHAAKGDFKAAYTFLDRARQVIAKTLSVARVQEASEADATAASSAAEADAFKKRLGPLISRIKEAAGTPAGDEAKTKAGQAGGLAQKRQFTEANALLDQIEQLLARPAEAADEKAAKRARLARAVSKGDNPFPQPGQPLEPELREVFIGQVESSASELTSRLDFLYKQIRTLHAVIEKADENWRRAHSAELLEELAGYRTAIEFNTKQLESLSQ